jgi:phospholipase C
MPPPVIPIPPSSIIISRSRISRTTPPARRRRAEHLKDERDMLRAIRDRTLPAVSFYKPIGADDEHPGYASLARGDYHAARSSIRSSKASSGTTL